MKVDYVIVGGGIYGSMIAWRMAQKGAEVMLLEAGEKIAAGASGGPGKRGVRGNGRDLRELPLLRKSYEIWPTLHEEIGAPTGFEQIGHLLLIERGRDRDGAGAREWMQNLQGIETHLVCQNELRELEPELSDRVIAALHCPNDGVADHSLTTTGVADAASACGAEIRTGVRAVSAGCMSGRVRSLVTSREEEIQVGRAVVLVSNTDVAGFLASEFGVVLPVWKWLPQAFFTEPIGRQLPQHLIGHAHRVLAMKPGPDTSVMISGGWRGRWNNESEMAEVRPEQVEGNLKEAREVFPSLSSVEAVKVMADRLESQTPDSIPIIDTAPVAQNLIFATGWCGHGWAIAPALGSLLAEWALTEKQPVCLRPFSYSRFGSAVAEKPKRA